MYHITGELEERYWCIYLILHGFEAFEFCFNNKGSTSPYGGLLFCLESSPGVISYQFPMNNHGLLQVLANYFLTYVRFLRGFANKRY